MNISMFNILDFQFHLVGCFAFVGYGLFEKNIRTIM